jgi:hypothetical protein
MCVGCMLSVEYVVCGCCVCGVVCCVLCVLLCVVVRVVVRVVCVCCLFVFVDLLHGDVAQMVERSLSMREVQGSIPCFSRRM